MKSTYCPNIKKMPLSSIFYALSDPLRIEIIQSLLKKSEMTCGQCTIQKSKSTMSHHFKVLREAGLIQKRGEGKNHYISVREDEIEARLPGFLDLIKKVNGPI